jgi:hypothetical protein
VSFFFSAAAGRAMASAKRNTMPRNFHDESKTFLLFKVTVAGGF